MIQFFNDNQAFFNFLATSVTAIATVALVYATWILAKLTRRMSEIASSPNIVVSIKPSPWSIIHLNQHISNIGSGAAFDIKVMTVAHSSTGEIKSLSPSVWSEMEVLPPAQELVSYIGSYPEYQDCLFEIVIEWKSAAGAGKSERKSYSIDVRKWREKGGALGKDPLVQIAEEVKKMRENGEKLSSGRTRLQTDVYDRVDRVEQATAEEQQRSDWINNHQNQGQQ